jgi:hypothetical protein
VQIGVRGQAARLHHPCFSLTLGWAMLCRANTALYCGAEKCLKQGRMDTTAKAAALQHGRV